MSQPKLLDQVREALRLKHHSLRTEKSYVRWIRRFVLFHNKRHPAEMGGEEIREFLSHLAIEGDVAASTQNQALSALLFLYRNVLGKELPATLDAVRAKRPQRVPTVFTRAEVQAILGEMKGVPRLVASLLYGSGLRLLECLRLRVKDVDAESLQITVRDAKGQKDRFTMLPQGVVEPIEFHLRRVRLLHEEDLREGLGTVYLPNALARKYPHAEGRWEWQYVFPAGTRSRDR